MVSSRTECKRGFKSERDRVDTHTPDIDSEEDSEEEESDDDCPVIRVVKGNGKDRVEESESESEFELDDALPYDSEDDSDEYSEQKSSEEEEKEEDSDDEKAAKSKATRVKRVKKEKVWNKELKQFERQGKSGLREPEYFQPEDISAAAARKKTITVEDVLGALESVSIPKTLRKNTKLSEDDQKYGMCLGAIKTYFKGVCASMEAVARPHLTSLLVRWMKQHKPGFKFTSIQVNKDYQSALHVDSNNMGPSYIVGLGDYLGGELWQQGRGAVDVKGRFVETNGNVPHATFPFAGTRYTLVYFCMQSISKVTPAEQAILSTKLGFPLPPLSMMPDACGSKSTRMTAGLKAYNAFLRSSQCPPAPTAAEAQAVELRAAVRRKRILRVKDPAARKVFLPLLLAEWARLKLPDTGKQEVVEHFNAESDLWEQMQAATITRIDLLIMLKKGWKGGKKWKAEAKTKYKKWCAENGIELKVKAAQVFACKSCAKVFKTQAGLAYHERAAVCQNRKKRKAVALGESDTEDDDEKETEKANDNDEDDDENAPDQSSRVFACKLCAKVFKQQAGLNYHERAAVCQNRKKRKAVALGESDTEDDDEKETEKANEEEEETEEENEEEDEHVSSRKQSSRVFACKLCAKVFKQQAGLAYHERAAVCQNRKKRKAVELGESDTDEEEETEQANEEEKEHVPSRKQSFKQSPKRLSKTSGLTCKSCAKVFKQQAGLDYHERAAVCQNRKKRWGGVTVESTKDDKKKTKEDAEFPNKFTNNTTVTNMYTRSASDDDVEDMPEEQTKAMAEAQKTKGNAAYGKGNNKTALTYYSMAINLDPLNAVYYSNRSACHAALSDWSSCLHDSNKTIQVRPEWFKGYTRLASAYSGLKQWKCAEEQYRKAAAFADAPASVHASLEEATENASKSAASIEEEKAWLENQQSGEYRRKMAEAGAASL